SLHVRGERDGDRLDVGQQGVDVGVGPGAVLFGQFLGGLGATAPDAREVQLRVFTQGRGVGQPGPGAGAEQSDAHAVASPRGITGITEDHWDPWGSLGERTPARRPRPRSRPSVPHAPDEGACGSGGPRRQSWVLMLTSHGTPKRSVHMPKTSPHICFSSGTDTEPPSDSFSQQPRSSLSSSPLRLTDMPPGGSYSTPGGLSAPISIRPEGLSSMPCMILSACGVSASPNSPNVLSRSSPPKTSR